MQFDPDMHALILTHKGADELRALFPQLHNPTEAFLHRVLTAALKGGEVLDEYRNDKGVVNLVRCTLRVAGGASIVAELNYRIERSTGRPAITHDGRRSLVYLAGCRAAEEVS